MEQLDFNLYINIVLGVIFGFAVLLGFMRGFKKSVYWLIVMVIYYTVFFLTLDLVVNAIYTYYTPQLGDVLGGFLPELSEVVTLRDALETLIESRVPDEYVSILTRDDVRVLIGSVGLFVLKIIYTIFYFTVLKFLYKFICWIIRLIFIRVNKDAPKRRLLGGFVGAIRGAMAVYIFFIFVGGLINIAENVYKVAPEDVKMDEVDQFLEAYNNNIFVQGLDYVPSIDKDTPMHFYLFDKIFSLDVEYEIKPLPPQEQTLVFLSNGYHPPLKIINQNAQGVIKVDVQIAFRKEIAIFASVYEYYINSDYCKSNNLNQITGDDIRTVFGIISNSDLINTIIPIAIEAGMEYFETEITIPREELYEINWKQELLILGDLAATTFDLINMAGLLDSEQELETIPFTGEDVQQIFDGLAESELVTFAAYVALEPLLKQIGGEVQAIITVPKDIDWKTEFRAIGSIIAAIIDTDITVSELRNPEPTQLIQRLSKLDFTIILNSKIIKGALINIFSGKVQIEGLDQIVIPEQVNWDEELQNILQAVNMIAAKVDKIDFNNLTLKVLAEFDEETIDKIFSSKILIATIAKFINEMDFGETPVILSNTVYDEDGYIKKSELTSVVNTFKMLIEQLPCDEQDQTCTELGFNYKGILTLNDNHVKQLLSSTIITETVGYMLLQQAGDMLTVPDSVKEKVVVNEEELEVIVKEELERLFNAIIIFSFENIENISFDETLINQLALENEDGSKILDPEKSSKLFGPESSVIIHASLSKMILDVAKEENSPLIVPYFDVDNKPIRIVGEDGLEYIAKSELENILNALIVIDMTDFNDVENISIQTLLANTNTLLQSAIIHATVSDQIIKQESEDIIIPLSVRVNVGETDKSTVYVKKVEIENIVQTLDILDVENLDNFTGDFTLTNLYESEEDRETVLSSEIIHATISKQIVKIRKTSDEDASGIVVPDSLLTEVEETELERTITLVKKTEIDAVIQAFGVLKINNVNEFDGKVNLNDLAKRPEEQQKLFNSVIVHATVSDQVLKLHRDGNIVVPSVDETEKAVITIDEEDNFEYIDKEEIYTIIDALVILGFSDVESYDGKVNLGILKGEQNPDKDDVLKSAIIRATISREIIKLTDDGTIVVPIDDEEGNEIKHIVDGDIALIDRDEIAILIDAVTIFIEPNENNEYLIDNFSGKVNIRKLTRENSENKDTILSSAIIRATISDKILDLDEGSKEILVPIKDETGKEIVKPVKGVRFIIREEISTLIDALAIFGEDDIENFSGTVDLSKLTDEENLYDDITDKELILSSAILRATVSRELINLDSNGTIVVPEVDEEEKVVIISVDETDRIVNFVKHNELSILIDASTILGFTDVQDYNGKVDLIKLFGDENPDKETVLSSAILRATISKEIVKLHDNGDIVVPNVDVDGRYIHKVINSNDFISRDEISELIDALVILGFSDVETYEGRVELGKLAGEENPDKEDVLDSAIIRATISREINALTTIVVPAVDDDNKTIKRLVGEVTFIDRSEISVLIDSVVIFMNPDENGNYYIDNFTGAIDLTKLTGANSANKTTVLSSAIIRATISDKIVELDGDEIVVPLKDDQDHSNKVIRRTIEGVDFIDKNEISTLIDALVILGFADVDNYTGNVDLSKLTDNDNLYDDRTDKEVILNSAILRATISREIIKLNGADIVVPRKDESGNSIINTVNEGDKAIDFVKKNEISTLIDALVILGFNDVENYDGNVDLGKLKGDDNPDKETVLDSTILRATISKKITELSGEDIEIPDIDVDDKEIRITVPGETAEYIDRDEISILIDSIVIFIEPNEEGEYHINNFTGDIDLNKLTGANSANKTTVLKSAIIRATISNKIIELATNGHIVVPNIDLTDREIIINKGTIDFIIKDEISALIDALDVLGIYNIDSYEGQVDLHKLTGDNEGNQDIILGSVIIHATISNQIIGLHNDNDIIVPSKDWENKDIILPVDGVGFIRIDEVKNIINALPILNIYDVTSFAGTVELDYLFNSTINQDKLLKSAIIHASISKQLLNISDDPDTELEVPKYKDDEEETEIIIEVNTDSGLVKFVEKEEIKALINVLDVLGLHDIKHFSGNVALTDFYNNETNQNKLLASATVHRTISKQMLTNSDFLVPEKDINDNPIRKTVQGIQYVEKDEIKALINALELLNVTDVSTFEDSFTLDQLSNDTNKERLLSSATIHATLSNELFELAEDGIIVVPNKSVENVKIQKTVQDTNFIVKDELMQVIDALIKMDYTSIGTIGNNINSQRFFDNRSILDSAIIHATISYKLLNETNDYLIIPDEYYGTSEPIRIMVEGVTFVDIDEINNILNALDALNLKDFSNIDLEPQNVFEVDFNILLNSASIQATLSREILANAEDENAPVGQEVLIIPQYYRQANLSAGTNTFTQIEKTELQRLLDALKSLSISEFNGIVDAQEITYNITRTTLETKLLVSGSIHVTIDRMLKGNDYISNKIPDKALEENELYGIADLVKTTEITNFILAAKEVEANDFIEAEFTFTQLQVLNEEKVDTILDSMIVRNSITIEIRDIVGDYLFYYYFDDADFEDEDPSTFLTEAAIKHAISNLPI